MGAFEPRAVTLGGRVVRLEPLSAAHADGLLAAGHHEALWRVTVQPPLVSADAVSRYLAQAAEQAARGNEVPFAIVSCETNAVIGSTRWMDIARPHRRVEIGGTWLAPTAQRTLANTEAKYLQLLHLFEVLAAVRVQFKTDLRNTQSQRALEKLGAIREGVLRRHMVVRDGFVRDSVYYGITDADWPSVKERLQERLSATGDTQQQRQPQQPEHGDH
ncbi:GNAT family N-acetyltransferase [Gemmatimonas groenlandica]|uniref:GNAT family N-acetyltransferase n=1 Tax=Gemmatimonas groenlandica TaxID=2732249 RepID=A0A6M4IVN7_9BACT|nr:GNAT family N-acetyltransferase [Gemmatimonas groenlandica]